LVTTADTLLSKALVRAGWPAGDGNAFLTYAEILALADEEIAGELHPLVRGLQTDFYVHSVDYSITADTPEYKLPAKASEQIRDVLYVDAAGNEFSVPWMPLEDIGDPGRYNVNGGYGVANAVGRYVAYYTGDTIGLRPTPASTDATLRVKYWRQPAALTEVTNARIISALTSATRLTMTASLPAAWTTGTVVDVINAGNAHYVHNPDLAVTGTGSAYIDVASYSSFVAAGDYVTVEGTTPIVPLPDVAVPLLVRRLALACLEAQKDVEAAAIERAAVTRLTGRLIEALKPRSKGDPSFIVARGSAFRTSPWGYR